MAENDIQLSTKQITDLVGHHNRDHGNKINKNTMVTTATTTPHHNQPHTHFIVSMKLFTLLWKCVAFQAHIVNRSP